MVSEFIGLTNVITILIRLVNDLAIFVYLEDQIAKGVKSRNGVSGFVFHLTIAIAMSLKSISCATVITRSGHRGLEVLLGGKLIPALVRPPFSGRSSLTGHLRACASDKTLDLCFPLVLRMSIGESSGHRVQRLSDEINQCLFIRTGLGIHPAGQWKEERRNRNGQAIGIQYQQPIFIGLENHIAGSVDGKLRGFLQGGRTKLLETE